MPATHMRRVQLGQQSAFTTPVTATSLLRGVTDGSVQIQHSDSVVQELGRNVSTLPVISQRYGEGEIELATTYEDILYALFGLFGPVAPSGNPPARVFNGPVSSFAAPQIYTVEYGTSGAEYRMVGAIIRDWTLRYEANANVTETWGLIGRNVQANGMASPTLRTVHPVLSRHATFYVDALGTPHGTTAIAGTAISFEMTIETNRHLKMFEDSNPLGWGEGRWNATMTIVAEFNAIAKAWVDALINSNVARNIRAEFIETANTREIQIDFVGMLTNAVELFSDRDGNMTVELEFSAIVGAPLSNWFSARVVNGVATLP